MNLVELVMRRRNVLEFIKADPIDLVLSRKAPPVRSAAGGWVQSPDAVVELASQLARIVQNKRRYNNGIVNSEAGDIPHTDYLLIGKHSLDVEVNDTFIWLGEHYQVTGIHKARTESFLCSIDLLGAENRSV